MVLVRITKGVIFHAGYENIILA